MKKLGVRVAMGCIMVAAWVAGRTAVAGSGVGPPPAGVARTALPMRATAGKSGPLAEISAGLSFTCARSVKGGAWCWGRNGEGQIGDGTNTDRSVPTPVAGLGSGVASIAVGYEMACALTTVGGVKCWGRNLHGLLADGKTKSRNTPREVTGLSSGVTSIAIRSHSAWVLMLDGGVRHWGPRSSGLLDEQVGLRSRISAIAPGVHHTCAIEATGGLLCWGSNDAGQLGFGAIGGGSEPVTVAGISNVVAVSGGMEHTCGLTSAGELWCWGGNNYGQLGDGTTTSRSIPTKVIGIGRVAAVSTGVCHTCAVTSSGGVKCWGHNSDGLLGNGGDSDTKVPVQVTGLTSGIAAVAGGGNHTCALTTTGNAWCWGISMYGELGGRIPKRTGTPVKVIGTW